MIGIGGETFSKSFEIMLSWCPESAQIFKNKEDFIQNAKVGDEFLRDIWDKVENPRYV